jgi:hypothetical protein
VLASLYPVITVALAAVTLKERVAGVQRVGIATRRRRVGHGLNLAARFSGGFHYSLQQFEVDLEHSLAFVMPMLYVLPEHLCRHSVSTHPSPKRRRRRPRCAASR